MARGVGGWASDVGDAWSLTDAAPSLEGGVEGLSDVAAPLFLLSPSVTPSSPSSPILVSPLVVPASTPKGRAADLMRARGFTWREGVEKFVCGSSAAPEAFRPWRDPGSEWLGTVAPYAISRTDAMRERVGALGSSPSLSLAPLVELSASTLFTLAQDKYAQLKDKSQWPKLAESLGVPLSKMDAVVKGYEKSVNDATKAYLRVDVSSLFASLRTALGAAGERIADQIAARARAAATALADKAGSAVGDGVAKALGEGLSTILPVLKAGWELYQGAAAEKEKAWGEFYAQFMDTWVLRFFRAAMERGLPVQWHVPDVYSLEPPKLGFASSDKWQPSEGMQGAAAFYQRGFVSLLALPIAQSAAIRRVWALAVQYMGDPTVSRTFAALGRNKSRFPVEGAGCYPVATDEIIAVVGVTVATAYGLEPWGFVRLLWGFAPSIFDAPPDARWEGYESRPSLPLPSGAPSWLAFEGKPGFPANGWALAWGSACVTALALAECMTEPVFLLTAAPKKKASAGGGGAAAVAVGAGLGLALLLL